MKDHEYSDNSRYIQTKMAVFNVNNSSNSSSCRRNSLLRFSKRGLIIDILIVFISVVICCNNNLVDAENRSVDLNCASVVKYSYVTKGAGFSKIPVPNSPLSGEHLRVCSSSMTCCTEEMEHLMAVQSKEDFDKSVKASLTTLSQVLKTRATKFDDFFKELLTKSKREFHEMFKRTYGIIYEEHSYVFTDLFEELEKYYAKGRVDLLEAMENFFNVLYQKMFTVLNQQYRFDDRYLICVSDHMKELKPFGDVPQKLSLQLKRSFVATRTFAQALAVAGEVAGNMVNLSPSAECTKAVMKMTQCPTCRGLPELKACSNYCINVMKGCLAYHTELDTEWNTFVDVMDKLVDRLLGPFNIEMVVQPINIKISEAIMNFQESSQQVSQRVFSSCGKPMLGRRKRTTTTVNQNGGDVKRFKSNESQQNDGSTRRSEQGSVRLTRQASFEVNMEEPPFPPRPPITWPPMPSDPRWRRDATRLESEPPRPPPVTWPPMPSDPRWRRDATRLEPEPDRVRLERDVDLGQSSMEVWTNVPIPMPAPPRPPEMAPRGRRQAPPAPQAPPVDGSRFETVTDEVRLVRDVGSLVRSRRWFGRGGTIVPIPRERPKDMPYAPNNNDNTQYKDWIPMKLEPYKPKPDPAAGLKYLDTKNMLAKFPKMYSRWRGDVSSSSSSSPVHSVENVDVRSRRVAGNQKAGGGGGELSTERLQFPRAGSKQLMGNGGGVSGGDDGEVEGAGSGVGLDQLMRDIRLRVRDTKQFWTRLPQHMCNSADSVAASASGNDDSCWNGAQKARYESRVTGDGLSPQQKNPEVVVDVSRPSTTLNEQLFALKTINNKLKAAHMGVDVDWIDIEESFGSGSGSGMGPDTDDTETDSMETGSGMGGGGIVGGGVEGEPGVPTSSKNDEDNYVHPSLEQQGGSRSANSHNLTTNGNSIHGISGANQLNAKITLNRALITYLVPVVVVWFGNGITEWVQ